MLVEEVARLLETTDRTSTLQYHSYPHTLHWNVLAISPSYKPPTYEKNQHTKMILAMTIHVVMALHFSTIISILQRGHLLMRSGAV